MVVQCTVFLALIAFHMYCIVTYARNTDNKLSKKMLSLVLAPLGTIVRWQLSKVNGLWQIKAFFVGTFLANFLACCIDGVVLGLQPHHGRSANIGGTVLLPEHLIPIGPQRMLLLLEFHPQIRVARVARHVGVHSPCSRADCRVQQSD